MKNLLITLTFLFAQTVLLAQPTPDDEVLYLTGSNHIQPPNSDQINTRNITKNRTIELWFNADDTSDRQVIYEEGGGTRGFSIYVDNNYVILGGWNKADYNPQWKATFVRFPIHASKWYYVAIRLKDALPTGADPELSGSGKFIASFYDPENGDFSTRIDKSTYGYEMHAHSGSISIGRSSTNLVYAAGNWGVASSVPDLPLSADPDIDFTGSTSPYDNYFSGMVWNLNIWDYAMGDEELNDTTNYTSADNDSGLLLTVDPESGTASTQSDSGTPTISNPDDTDNSYFTYTSGDWTSNTAWLNNSQKIQSGTDHILFVGRDNSLRLTGVNLEDLDSLQVDQVILKGNLTLEEGFKLKTKDIIVEGDVKLTLQSGAELRVNGELHFKGSPADPEEFNLVLENNSSLYQGPTSEIFYDGIPRIRVMRGRDYSASYVYSYLANPIAGGAEDMSVVFPNTDLNYIYYFDNASQNWQGQSSGAMTPWIGYAVTAPNDAADVTDEMRYFDGNALFNQASVAAQYAIPADGEYALLGNSFVSPLNWQKLAADNVGILNGTCYLWDQQLEASNNSNDAGNYVSLNGLGSNVPSWDYLIPSGMGFFVESEALTATTVNVDNSHRASKFQVIGDFPNQLMKKSATVSERLWLTLENQGGQSSVLLAFDPRSTDAYDGLYDGKIFSLNPITLMVLQDDLQLSIQGNAPIRTEKTIPLGVKSPVGMAKISIAQVENFSDKQVLLHDKLLNAHHDLLIGPYEYQVATEKLNGERFELIVSKKSELSDHVEDVNTTDIRMVHGNEELSVVGLDQAPLSVMITTLDGRVMPQEDCRFANAVLLIRTVQLPDGVYMLTLDLGEKGTVSQLFKL